MLRHRTVVVSRGQLRFRVDKRAIPHRHSVRTRDIETYSSRTHIALESLEKCNRGPHRIGPTARWTNTAPGEALAIRR